MKPNDATAVAVLAALIAATSCARQSANYIFVPKNPSGLDQKARLTHTWANQPWTGDDKPYQQIRDAIDKAVSEGKEPNDLRIQYGIVAQNKPDDPQAQFAWAYAARKSMSPNNSNSQNNNVLYGIPEALTHVPDPHTYNFSRLRFLVEVDNPDFEGLGERLLHRDMSDDKVKDKLIKVYDIILLRKDLYRTVPAGLKQRALSYANELIHSNPENANCYASLGWVYMASWSRDHNRPDGQQAVANFQKYLQLAPPNTEWRKSAEGFIGMIQKVQ